MTPLFKELEDLILKIDNEATAGKIPKDEIMYIAGHLTGSGIALGNKYREHGKK